MMTRRIFLDKHAEVFCVVSEEDYAWLAQWKWTFRFDRWKRKRYAVRNTWRGGKRVTLYMHKEILSERMGQEPPTPAHTIGDHRNGDSLCNTRNNLEWVTPKGNAATSRRWAA